MEVIQTINGLRALLSERRLGKENKENKGIIGFIPTMGFLHEGHVSLIEAAHKQCDTVVLSIFVNPMQFGPNEDYEKYPRNPENDVALAKKAGVNIVFLPEVAEIYPYYPLMSKVTVGKITAGLCAATRPGHFDGVATVVLKLLNIVQPDFAYFGLKDAQQVAVVQQIVTDFNLTTRIVPCPTIREVDGLAKSSRNVYLSTGEREQAVILNQALVRAKEWMNETNMTYGKLHQLITQMITSCPLAKIDYIEILSYPSFGPILDHTRIHEASSKIIIALAVKFGKTRLIDNCIISFEGGRFHV